jgi:type I restriction enzyme M protein
MSEQEATIGLAEGYLTDLVTGQPKKETDIERIRQNFERTLIEEYFCTAEDIGVDVQLRGDNVRRKFGLVVYNVEQERSQDSIRIVIDIADPKKKQTDKRGGVEDLRSALIACENAEFGVWTNGVDRIVIQKVRKRFESELSEVTDFPRRGESEILTKSRSNLRIATGSNLLYAFQRCHNFIHGNQGGSKEGIFWELLKIIFAKIQDERNERQEPEFAIRSLEERRTAEGHRLVKQLSSVPIPWPDEDVRKEIGNLILRAGELRFDAQEHKRHAQRILTEQIS